MYQSVFTILFRYNEVFLIVDTCQAYSMTQKLYSPNILGVGSSLVGEDSLSVSKPFYYFLKLCVLLRAKGDGSISNKRE